LIKNLIMGAGAIYLISATIGFSEFFWFAGIIALLAWAAKK